MISLNSKIGKRKLKSFLNRDTLLAFDFDGTIAPIHPHPKRARLSPQTRKMLIELSQYFQIAIVTGRSKSEIKKKVKVPQFIYIGNHGIEGAASVKKLKQAKSACKRWEMTLKASGLPRKSYLEQKTYSISIHFRMCADPQKAHDQIRKMIFQLKPSPKVVDGKFTFNLLTRNSPHKGTALLQIMKKLKCRSAIYFGDDVTDEHVFKMKKDNIFSVHIGKKKSAAHYRIASQNKMNDVLQELLRISANHVP